MELAKVYLGTGKVFNLPNPDMEPRTYIFEMNGKLYQRTRAHLRPRDINPPPTATKEYNSVPISPQVTFEADVGQPTANLQPAVTPAKEESDPATPKTSTEGPNSVPSALQALGSPVKMPRNQIWTAGAGSSRVQRMMITNC